MKSTITPELQLAIDEILEKYLDNDSFSGTLFSEIIDKCGGVVHAKSVVKDLLATGLVEIYCCNTNPYVKLFDASQKQEDIQKTLQNLPNNLKRKPKDYSGVKVIVANDYDAFSFFPTKKLLNKKIGRKKKYLELPAFKKMLALGSCQFETIFFPVSALDRYIDDPRYEVRYSDFVASIWNREDEDMYLKSIGLAYNVETKENFACAFVYDLSKLIEAHQWHFFSHMIKDTKNLKIDNDFYITQIGGNWPTNDSIFTAFLEEILIINKITQMFICGEKLFLNEFNYETRNQLDSFHPFLKPTTKSYDDFCRTLDKLFTDNIDKKCIVKMNNMRGSLIDIKVEENGEVKEGTLSLLERFVRGYFKALDGSDSARKVVDVWKKDIRRTRSKASHHIIENKYDNEIFKKYYETMEKAYISIRTLRLVLTNYPGVRSAQETDLIKVPDLLYKGKIRNYFCYNHVIE